MVEDDTYFYKWDGIGENWITSEASFDRDYPTKPYDSGDSMAAWIIETIFGLKLDLSSQNLGGALPGYDIKDRDAYQIVQMSLATELINNKVMECYATEDGAIKFFEIGTKNSNIGNDVLYKIDGGELKAKCDKVLVTGYDPPPKRYTKDEPYNLFEFARKNPDWQEDDPDVFKYPRYYIYGDALGPEACDYFREGYIEYGKLNFNMESVICGNNYKIEKIPNYIYKVTVPFYQSGSTDVNFRNATPRYMPLNGFGKLQRRNWKPKGVYMPSMCLPETDIEPDVGVFLEESDSDKFLRVSAVYIWGYLVKNIRDGEKDDYITSASIFAVDVDSMLCQSYRLSEGDDYLIRKKTGGEKGYRIIFSSNVSENYKKYFGGLFAETTSFRVGMNNIFNDKDAIEPAVLIPPFDDVEGYLRDGKSPVSSKILYDALLFPLNEGQSAYALPANLGKIIVVYEWDNPCIQITDLRNEVTEENLRQVKIEFYPMIIQDKNPPQVLVAGENTIVLDPTEVVPDIDCRTVENLQNTEYVRAVSQLEQGDISVVMPFVDEGGCKTIAKFIYDHQNEVAHDVTYTCSPDAEPVLGERIDGNVINAIDYSYQDSSQYLISVKAGAIWQGINSWNQSLYNMQTESVQLEGLVIGVDKDNIKCNIDLKRLGVMECVNISKEIIEVGDKVQVTVQNNPVSL